MPRFIEPGPPSTAARGDLTGSFPDVTLAEDRIKTSVLQAAGDLVTASAAETPSRLVVGATDQEIAVVAGLPAYVDGVRKVLTTVGDIPYLSATSPKTIGRLAAPASGLVLTGNGAGVAPSWQPAGGAVGGAFGVGLGIDSVATHLPGVTTMMYEGPPRAAGSYGYTINGTPNAVNVFMAQGSRFYAVRYDSGASIGNLAGWTFYSSGAGFLARSAVSAVIVTGSNITSQRVWVGGLFGTTSNVLHPLAPPTAEVAIPVAACRGYGMAYDSAVGPNWLAVTADGTNWSGTDTGVVVAATTAYSLSMDNSVYGTITFRIQPWTLWSAVGDTTTIAKTTNYPVDNGSGINPPEISLRNLAASSRSLHIQHAKWRTM